MGVNFCVLKHSKHSSLLTEVPAIVVEMCFFFPLSSPHIIDCRGAHVKSRGAQLPWKCHMLLWFWCGGVGIALGLMSLNDSISGYSAMFDWDGTLPPMDTLLGNSVNQVRDQ